MFVVGLTGGVASGKSTVSSMLSIHPIHLIDADLVARDVVAPGQPALDEIRARFGEQVLLPNGALDRARLGKIVFSDRGQRQELNRIIHPYILAEENARLAAIKATDAQAVVVIDAALLIEAKAYERVDRIVVVWVDQATQLDRLMNRDGLDRDEAVQRIDSQMPLDEKLTYADFVIDNRADLEHTRAQVEQLWAELLQHREARLSNASRKGAPSRGKED